jgi:hypothetical protein
MTPESFRTDLKRFDKRLDFVWNGAAASWEVVGVDKRNIKYVIKSIPLGKLETLGTWVLQDLYECSPMKQGGERALNRIIDEDIERLEQIQEKDFQNKLDAVNDDAYIRLKYGTGERVSFSGVGEKHESGFTVTDRRTASL